MPMAATTIGKMNQSKPVISSSVQFHNLVFIGIYYLTIYSYCANRDLSIPEGVSVMTVALMGWMWPPGLGSNVPSIPGAAGGIFRPRCLTL